MRDCDPSDLPSPAGLVGELVNLRQRHRLVGLVLQAQHLAADIVLARGADEGADGARRRVRDGGFKRCYIDVIANNLDRAYPWRSIGAAADRRNEGDLIVRARTIIVLD